MGRIATKSQVFYWKWLLYFILTCNCQINGQLVGADRFESRDLVKERSDLSELLARMPQSKAIGEGFDNQFRSSGTQALYHPAPFPEKRDARIQTRSAASRYRTLTRIDAPCAGTQEHRTVAPLQVASPVNITPRDLLETLSSEASDAAHMVKNLRRQYETMGVIDVTAPFLRQSGLVTFHLTERDLDSGSSRVLNKMYRELARAVVIMQEMKEESTVPFTDMLSSLKEDHIFNMLCGVKVVMDSQRLSPSESAVEMLENTSLVDAPNLSWRLSRDYAILRDMTKLFEQARTIFSELARHL